MRHRELTPDEEERAQGPAAAATAYSTGELTAAFRRPDRMLAIALGESERVSRSLIENRHLGLLTALLLLCGLAGTVAYGGLSPARNWWSTSVLFLGSLSLCFPSLHVFALFCGVRLGLGQMLALALTLTCAAGLFALGFAPIIWFLDWSIGVDGRLAVTPRGLSLTLLGVSLLMGAVQMARCLSACQRGRQDGGVLGVIVALWLPLFLFITCRMARLLGLL